MENTMLCPSVSPLDQVAVNAWIGGPCSDERTGEHAGPADRVSTTALQLGNGEQSECFSIVGGELGLSAPWDLVSESHS